MRSFLFSLCLAVAPLLATPARAADAAQPPAKGFELLDGDRVVFVGGTFFEREAKWGYIETALSSRFPDRNVTFRNLGYAGDTVRCEARTVCEGWANFGPPQEGFDRLKTLIGEIKPTVVFVAYGMGESFEGEKALPQFVADYNKLLDMLTEASRGKPRFVLIGPNQHFDLGRPLPDPAEHNRLLKLYSKSIEQLGSSRGAQLVDLLDAMTPPQKDGSAQMISDDGVQLTRAGYLGVSRIIDQALFGPRQFQLCLDAQAKVTWQEGLKTGKADATKSGFKLSITLDRLLFAPASEEGLPARTIQIGLPLLIVRGMAPGHYALKWEEKQDGGEIPATTEQLSVGIHFGGTGPESDQAEQLRQLIVAKNADYFNYWRHENDTYIMGYRKHEQGKNAVEFPEWVKLTEEKDKEIAKLRVPQPVTYTLAQDEKAGK